MRRTPYMCVCAYTGCWCWCVCVCGHVVYGLLCGVSCVLTPLVPRYTRRAVASLCSSALLTRARHLACVMCAWGAGPADGWRNHYILPNHLNHHHHHHHQHQRPLQDVTADNRRFTERRKKTVRFDHGDGSSGAVVSTGAAGVGTVTWPPPGAWDEERQGSQDSQTKDSGIDTSSTFTSSEDSNRGDVPKVGTTYTHNNHTYSIHSFSHHHHHHHHHYVLNTVCSDQVC